MTSSVFFKFKSSKEPQQIRFDGTGISVFELKREIIAVSGLGDGTDFDLFIYPEDNPTQEYDDDTTIISRSSTVIARRLPAQKGVGRAARYVSGRPPVRAIKKAEPGKPTGSSATTSNAPMTDEDREAAFFQEENAVWAQQKESMSHAKPVFHKKKPVNVPDHDPPPGYVCYRCQKKGHWIQACPTNDDPNFKPQPRAKRTTGIPRSFLKTVEKPTGDDLEEHRGIMLNAEGEYVTVMTDTKTWEKFQEKAKASAAQAASVDAAHKEIQARGLECPIDKRMFVEPVKTPCCGKTYCHDCIENALADGDLVCPNCSTEGVLIDDLAMDEEMVEKIRAYEAEKAKERLEKDQQAKEEAKAAANPSSPSNNEQVSVSTPTDEKAKASEMNRSGSKSPKPSANGIPVSSSDVSTPLTVAAIQPTSTPTPGAGGGNGSDTDTSSTSKKRKADNDILPPTAPKAMRREQEARQKAQSMNVIDQVDEMKKALDSMSQMPNVTMGMNMPNIMNPMMGMMGQSNMNGMNGMNMNQMNGWSGYNNGYQNNMYNMPYGNMNQMNGMNGMNMYGGMNANNMGGNMSYGGWNQNNYGQNMGYQNQNMQNHMSSNTAGFPNQQRTIFADPFPGDDEPYMRKPVNPQRHQNRQRRQRPSDYHSVV